MRLLDVKRDEVGGVGLLPTGSLEQHGPHLPMGTDCILSQYVAEEAAKEVPESLLFPALCYGVSLEHQGFPYVGVSGETFMKLVREVLETSTSAGVRRTVIVNGHGGNEPYLKVVQREFNFSHREAKVYVHNLATYGGDLHAGVRETSELYVVNRELVDSERMRSVDPSFREGIFERLGSRRQRRTEWQIRQVGWWWTKSWGGGCSGRTFSGSSPSSGSS